MWGRSAGLGFLETNQFSQLESNLLVVLGLKSNIQFLCLISIITGNGTLTNTSEFQEVRKLKRGINLRECFAQIVTQIECQCNATGCMCRLQMINLRIFRIREFEHGKFLSGQCDSLHRPIKSKWGDVVNVYRNTIAFSDGASELNLLNFRIG